MKHKPKGTMPTIKEWLKEVKSKTKNKCIPHVDVGEDVEQISLSIQQRAADKLNRGEKPYIASKVYVDYLNTIIMKRVKLLFAWYDLWIGFFWDSKKQWLYFFPIPMFGIIIKFKL